MARKLTGEEGVMVGASTGAAVTSAIKVRFTPNIPTFAGKTPAFEFRYEHRNCYSNDLLIVVNYLLVAFKNDTLNNKTCVKK